MCDRKIPVLDMRRRYNLTAAERNPTKVAFALVYVRVTINLVNTTDFLSVLVMGILTG